MWFNNVVFEAAYGTAAQLPVSDLPEIVFSGRSNVGKSSLINKLFNRKALAKVSSTPGKTATVNFYRAGDVRIVDLPGYGYAKVSGSEQKRWADLMDGYFAGNRRICLVVQLIDMRHPPTRLDNQMLEFLCSCGYNFIIALTKCDKLNQTQTRQRLQALENELNMLPQTPVCIPVSAVKGEGIIQLQEQLSFFVENGGM